MSAGALPSDIVAFLRAFPQTRETLCSEPVLAWLARSNEAARGIDGAEQRALYARCGFWRATADVLDRIGMRLAKPATVTPGAAVLARIGGSLVVFGIAGDGPTFIAASGVVRCERVPVLRVLEMKEQDGAKSGQDQHPA